MFTGRHKIYNGITFVRSRENRCNEVTGNCNVFIFKQLFVKTHVVKLLLFLPK